MFTPAEIRDELLKVDRSSREKALELLLLHEYSEMEEDPDGVYRIYLLLAYLFEPTDILKGLLEK